MKCFSFPFIFDSLVFLVRVTIFSNTSSKLSPLWEFFSEADFHVLRLQLVPVRDEHGARAPAAAPCRADDLLLGARRKARVQQGGTAEGQGGTLPRDSDYGQKPPTLMAQRGQARGVSDHLEVGEGCIQVAPEPRLLVLGRGWVCGGSWRTEERRGVPSHSSAVGLLTNSFNFPLSENGCNSPLLLKGRFSGMRLWYFLVVLYTS